MSQSLAQKIISQVEFYFSDANLPRDKFLLQQILENAGYVPVATLASFARMKALTEDLDVILAALKESTFLELSECGKNVKRRVAYDPESIGEADGLKNAVYVKGFPAEATLEELQEFFQRTFPDTKVLAIRMRRHGNDVKVFKGSVFVEVENAEKAASLASSTGSIKYGESELIFKTKEKYFEDKNAERAEKASSKKSKKSSESEFVPVKGCLLKITAGISKDENPITVRQFLNSLSIGSAIKFVDLAAEGCQAVVRIGDPIADEFAKKLSAMQVKMPIQSSDGETENVALIAEVISGEEEDSYLQKSIAERRSSERRTKPAFGNKKRRKF